MKEASGPDRSRTARAALAALALVLVDSGTAQALSFNFTQTGYAGNARVTGFVSGSDLNGDGALSLAAGEIDDFNMFFSGNSFVGAFALGLGQLGAFVWDLGGGLLGDGAAEGVSVSDGTYLYASGQGVLGVDGGRVEVFGAFSTTPQPIQVPEPGPAWLLGWGLLALAVRETGFGRVRHPARVTRRGGRRRSARALDACGSAPASRRR